MKIMHISDLHLGRSLNGFDMIEDQKHALNEVVKAVLLNEIKYLLIVGDVFDKYIPAVEAQELFGEFLRELTNLKIKVIVISGNHDQAERLSYLSSFLKQDDIYIISSIEEANKPLIFKEDNIAICAVPYLNSAKIRLYFKDEIDVLDGHKKIIDSFFDSVPKDCVKIAMCHNFLLGGEESASERILSLGALEQLPAGLFKDFDYVALGHLHKKQKISSNAYYSGSILKYSEKEHQNKNGYIIYDTISKDIIFNEITPLRQMIYIKSKFDDLKNYIEYSNDYVYIEILDDDKIVDLMQKVKKQFPYCLGISKQNHQSSVIEIKKIEQKSDVDLFCDFYNMVSGKEITSEQKEAIISILNEIEVEE